MTIDPLVPLAPVCRVGGAEADDWAGSMGFEYQLVEADGTTPIDIAGWAVGAFLWTPFTTLSQGLTVANGYAAVGGNGLFAYRVPAVVIQAIAPSPALGALHGYLITPEGYRNTVLIQPIDIVLGRSGNALAVRPALPTPVIWPGENSVSFSGGLPSALDFSNPLNSGLFEAVLP